MHRLLQRSAHAPFTERQALSRQFWLLHTHVRAGCAPRLLVEHRERICPSRALRCVTVLKQRLARPAGDIAQEAPSSRQRKQA